MPTRSLNVLLFALKEPKFSTIIRLQPPNIRVDRRLPHRLLSIPPPGFPTGEGTVRSLLVNLLNMSHSRYPPDPPIQVLETQIFPHPLLR